MVYNQSCDWSYSFSSAGAADGPLDRAQALLEDFARFGAAATI
jgi:hypothetical protein